MGTKDLIFSIQFDAWNSGGGRLQKYRCVFVSQREGHDNDGYGGIYSLIGADWDLGGAWIPCHPSECMLMWGNNGFASKKMDKLESIHCKWHDMISIRPYAIHIIPFLEDHALKTQCQL